MPRFIRAIECGAPAFRVRKTNVDRHNLSVLSSVVRARRDHEWLLQLREKTARSNAVVLEMIGDLPDADMKPPENVLFVCKLNPVTTDDDLEIIFTRYDIHPMSACFLSFIIWLFCILSDD